MFYVLVGRSSMQLWETSSPTLSDGFRTRDEAEKWIQEYKEARKTTRQRTPEAETPLRIHHNDAHPQERVNQDIKPEDATYFSVPIIPTLPRNYEMDIAEPPAVVAAPEQEIVLSAEQQYVLDIVKRGGNVFFTGPAGTGKSVLLREIVKALRTSSQPGFVAITAPTGIAGINIGGCTIHSFAGIGLGKEEEEPLAKRIKESSRLSQRWKEVGTLIIDEVSMLEGRLFDKLEFIARYVRSTPRPFGGIQLILSGDFCQLPPVPDESHQHRMASTFCFDAKSWSACIPQPPVRLTKVFRQRDNQFVDILSAMRVGELSDDQVGALTRLSRPLIYEDGIEPTELYPTRAEVDACNQRRLRDLSGPSHTYIAMDRAGVDIRGRPIAKDEAMRLLDRLSIVPKTTTMKTGAQVMLIKNIAQGSMVNGSTGKIIEFITIAGALKRQIQISLPNRGENKQGNGVTSGNVDGRLLGTERYMVSINDAVFTKSQLFPLVQFANGLLLLCAPTNFSIEGFIGNVECERLQVPLILAWAMSVHKSQGQTLSRVKIDLARIFEKGQTYVAISRATTMESLEIRNFNPIKVQAHPRVLAWEAEWTARSTVVIASAAEGSTEGQPNSNDNNDEDMWEEFDTAWEETQNITDSQQSQARYEGDPGDETLWEEMDSKDAIAHYYR